MNRHRLQSEPELTDNKGDTSPHTSTQVVAMAARKPSERFMRRSLQVRSKASNSERFCVAALKEKLNGPIGEMTNEASVFNGYRPGHEAMPG